eukprot:TRINITY_DN10525_c0_g1_i1.p1 TRINITY_DN10525_c0_g1~~TRINITY_DN10525_c0_g1_i1.p1  ORF type:complete len:63 (+),score=0.21 TRINITY_DN10525_c0_g1_i1:214-402(+)
MLRQIGVSTIKYMVVPRKICSRQMSTFVSKTKLSRMNTKLRSRDAEIFFKKYFSNVWCLCYL